MSFELVDRWDAPSRLCFSSTLEFPPFNQTRLLQLLPKPSKGKKKKNLHASYSLLKQDDILPHDPHAASLPSSSSLSLRCSLDTPQHMFRPLVTPFKLLLPAHPTDEHVPSLGPMGRDFYKKGDAFRSGQLASSPHTLSPFPSSSFLPSIAKGKTAFVFEILVTHLHQQS